MCFIDGIAEGWLPDIGTCGESARQHLSNMSFQGRKQSVNLCHWIRKNYVPRHYWSLIGLVG